MSPFVVPATRVWWAGGGGLSSPDAQLRTSGSSVPAGQDFELGGFTPEATGRKPHSRQSLSPSPVLPHSSAPALPPTEVGPFSLGGITEPARDGVTAAVRPQLHLGGKLQRAVIPQVALVTSPVSLHPTGLPRDREWALLSRACFPTS